MLLSGHLPGDSGLPEASGLKGLPAWTPPPLLRRTNDRINYSECLKTFITIIERDIEHRKHQKQNQQDVLDGYMTVAEYKLFDTPNASIPGIPAKYIMSLSSFYESFITGCSGNLEDTTSLYFSTALSLKELLLDEIHVYLKSQDSCFFQQVTMESFQSLLVDYKYSLSLCQLRGLIDHPEKFITAYLIMFIVKRDCLPDNVSIYSFCDVAQTSGSKYKWKYSEIIKSIRDHIVKWAPQSDIRAEFMNSILSYRYYVDSILNLKFDDFLHFGY